MPQKRSRLMRSESIDSELVVATRRPPAPSHPAVWRQPSPLSPIVVAPEASNPKPPPQARRPSIFMIHPVQEQLPFDWRHNFFEKCYACNKKISTESEIYMYRDLQAFCNVECRERQMIMDAIMAAREKAMKRAEARLKWPTAPQVYNA